MGDPRKLKRKYETPRQLFDIERIEGERKLMRDYGLKNIKEVWVAMRELKRIRRGARRLISLGEEGAEEGKKVLIRTNRLGIVKEKGDATLEDLLTLTVQDLLERRLQTRVMRNGLARTMKQSRQLITHGFISIGGKMVSVPSYVVAVDEEQTLSYYKGIDVGVVEEATERTEEGEEKEKEKPEEKAEETEKKEEKKEEAKPAEKPEEKKEKVEKEKKEEKPKEEKAKPKEKEEKEAKPKEKEVKKEKESKKEGKKKVKEEKQAGEEEKKEEGMRRDLSEQEKSEGRRERSHLMGKEKNKG